MGRPSSPTNPVAAWLEIKAVLRRRMGARDYNDWVQGGRLLRVLGGDTLLAAFPPSGRVLFKAQGWLPVMRHLAWRQGYGLVLTVYPDDHQRDSARARHGWDPRFMDPQPSQELPDGFEPPPTPQEEDPPEVGVSHPKKEYRHNGTAHAL